MKKITFILIACIFLTTQLFAQGPKGREDQLKGLKIAHITQELDLSSQEAEKFWPLYNAHQDNMLNYRKEQGRSSFKRIKDKGGVDALSDEEAAAIIDNFISIDAKIQKEKEQFYNSLTGILSPKKILKLHIAEADFNRRILQRLRKEGKGRENKKQ